MLKMFYWRNSVLLLQYCLLSRCWIWKLRKSIFNLLGSVAVIRIFGGDTCTEGPELVTCKGNTLTVCTWWWIIVTVSCQSREGETVPCYHGFKSIWMGMCVKLNCFSGWRICILKWSFSLCFTFYWMPLLWSEKRLIFMFVFLFPRYFYGLCCSGVSVCPRHLWIYSENAPVR